MIVYDDTLTDRQIIDRPMEQTDRLMADRPFNKETDQPVNKQINQQTDEPKQQTYRHIRQMNDLRKYNINIF